MDAMRGTGAGLVPASGDDCPTSTDSVSLSAEQIYHDYAPRVYNMARRMVRSDADAEDVTQDVLLQVVRKLPTFRGESALPTWLHRVTVNTAISHRRRRAVREDRRSRDPFDIVLADEPAPDTGWDGASAPEAHLLSRESRALIERAIAGLPSIYRTVFVLADVEGLPNSEIADRLDLSLPAIKSRLHRARQLMRDTLAPHFREMTIHGQLA
ncbi:MAG TPA: sigma-70 family RNA polymerase sigma factor [Gemmataceae bacterium]|nr:sigma-70 family RNA polymerase sigma factor [Gemmataceae bacterium]